MNRIFTTQFTFDHQDFDAIVTVIPKEDTMLFSVKVLDMELHEILPGGAFSYLASSGLNEYTRYDNKLSLRLTQSIAAAIDEHMASIQ